MILEKKISIPTKWEYIVPLFATVSLLLSCVIVSSKKYFWNDELLSFYLLNDQSFVHMMAALADKINNAPPLYFAFGWLWAQLFTSTELSLRLFSSFGICVAFIIAWVALRRTYHFWSVSIATLAVFCLSGLILQQNAEARFYGLFLAVCSLGLLHYDTLCRTERRSSVLILANACIHALIVQTHIFGFLYSGAILFALVVRDRYFAVFRPQIYLSVILGWLSFVPWIGAFLNQADLGTPRSWIPIPGIQDLINSFTLSRYFFLILLTISAAILINNAMAIRFNDANRVLPFETSEEETRDARMETSLLILAYSFFAVPILAWVISHTIEPIFINRYMIPTELSWTILLAALLSRIILPISMLSENVSAKLGSLRLLISTKILLVLGLTVILLLHPVHYASKFPERQVPGLNDGSYGYNGLPIAMEFSHPFLQRFQYSPERSRYFFILDWYAALDKASGLFSPGEYKTMHALKRNYPRLFRKNILQGEEFLNIHERFLVLDYDNNCSYKDVVCPRWFETRIKNNPQYKVKKIGIVDGMNLVLVEAKE